MPAADTAPSAAQVPSCTELSDQAMAADPTIFVMGEETHKVRGVLMRDLVKYVGGKGQSVKITSLDGYALDIPMSDFEAYDAVV